MIALNKELREFGKLTLAMPGLYKDMPFGKEDTKQLIVHKGRSANDSFDSIWYIITIKPRCY